MSAFGTVYVALLGVSLLASLAALVLAWRRRPAREADALVVLLVGGMIWISGTLVSILADPFWLSSLASTVTYVGIVLVSPSFLVLALLYTGREEWVTRRLVLALAVEPVLALVAVWVAPDLFRSVSPAPGTLAGIDTAHGPLFWVHVAYSYVLTVAATGLLLDLLYRSRYLYREQVVALLFASLAPWVSNVLYLSGTVPHDLTPVAFAVSGIALAWAILEVGFIDLAPVARDTVVDHLTRGVYVFDANDRLVDVNAAGREQLLLEEDPIGADFETLASDYPELAATFADACEHREVIQVDTATGRRAFDVEVTELRDYRDRTQGRVFLVQDVTDQRRREQQLRRQNEQLDQFASVVSHDLRNPINVMDGYIELARETGDVSHLEEASASIERMEALIDDVLTLAREGRAIESTEPVGIRDVAEEAWRNVSSDGASLTVSGDLTVAADRSRLLQTLENLFRNAVEHGSTSPESQAHQDAVEHGSTGSRPEADDASDQGGPGVTVEVGPLADAPGFYVQDDGPGIPAEHRDRIFEFGYTTGREGTGLGLSIVRTVAEAHGWTVTLADGPGGARFEFEGVDLVPPSADRSRGWSERA